MTEHQDTPPSSNPGSVSIGCGSLILIAIIVAMFSGSSKVSGVENKLRRLQSDVRNLESDIGSLERKLDTVIEMLERERDK